MTGKLLLKNLWIADGIGAPLKKGACLIDTDGTIAAVEKEFSACAAVKTIDGGGAILGPGFIDAHGHSDLSALSAPECFSKVSQGVTSEVCGNCGLSAFPVTEINKAHLQSLYENYGKEITWASCADYMNFCRLAGTALSLFPLCGHNTLHAAVKGYEKGDCTGAELEEMCALLESAFAAGAPGLSFGLLYTPGIFASQEEISALMTVAARQKRICTAHLRSEGSELLESVSEMIELSLASGLKHFHISHLKTAGEPNFSKIDKLFELFEEARERGLEITCDRYPYIESMTQLSVSLPGKWKELDDDTLKKQLSSPEEKALLCAALREAKEPSYWEKCRLINTTHPRYTPFKGMKMTAVPGDTVENVVELLSFDAVNCQAAFDVMSNENMKRIIMQPFCVAGSDGNALPADGRFGSTHPRSFGAIARFVRLLLDMGASIEESVRKCSGMTAEIFRLENVGRIAPGMQGDLVVFDPDSIDGRADFAAPETLAEGVILTVKNGEIIYNR